MAKTNVTATQFAAKKLLGKTQVRPSLTDAQEAYPSNVSVPGAGVFAESIPRVQVVQSLGSRFLVLVRH